jgi:hypothetical protein
MKWKRGEPPTFWGSFNKPHGQTNSKELSACGVISSYSFSVADPPQRVGYCYDVLANLSYFLNGPPHLISHC